MPSPFWKRIIIGALSVMLAFIVLNGLLSGPRDFNKVEAMENIITEAQVLAQGLAQRAKETQIFLRTPSLNVSKSNLSSASAEKLVKTTSIPIRTETTFLPQSNTINSATDKFLLTFKSECQAMEVPKELMASTDGLQQCPCIPDKLGKYACINYSLTTSLKTALVCMS